MGTKPKKLKRDGAYTGPYGNICAYNTEGHERKEEFLRDAKALLQETGQHLAARGLTQMEVRVNEGGIAVSGEVYAEFWDPADPLRHVWVEVSATSLRSLSGRGDGASILARVQEYRCGKARRAKKGGPQLERGAMGPNIWLSPEMDSRQLAERLLTIYDPARTPRQGVVYAAGEPEAVPLPPLIVNNFEEGTRAMEQWQRVEAAVAADQQAAVEATPLPLFDLPVKAA